MTAARLRTARFAAVLTGAGMSAESGVPTFRSGAGALWSRFKPEELATPEAFARRPDVVWAWYASRIAALSDVKPNAGHIALVRITQFVGRLTVITQNVDGFHAAAGSRDLVELHGDIRIARCTQCGASCDARSALGLDHQTFDGVASCGSIEPPHCECGGMLRPDVVWFGEPLPPGAIEHAEVVVKNADVFIVAGTSALVYPAAGLVPIARSSGAFVVEVNPEETPASSLCDLRVRAKTGEFLPMVAAAL